MKNLEWVFRLVLGISTTVVLFLLLMYIVYIPAVTSWTLHLFLVSGVYFQPWLELLLNFGTIECLSVFVTVQDLHNM